MKYNDAFRSLTNFVPTEIENKPCYKLIEAIQQVKDNKGRDIYLALCLAECRFRIANDIRRIKYPVSLRNVWINSNDKNNHEIKRLVDILIFPFETENNMFALHLLVDKKQWRDRTCFEDILVEKVSPPDYPHTDNEPYL